MSYEQEEFMEEMKRNRSPEDQAVFRLGQMDFQQCAADMLEDAAKEANGLVASTLLHAAALVRDMKVPGGADER